VHLARSLKIFDSMEKPGTLGFLTSDQARKEREGVEKKVEELRTRLAEFENTAASALKEEQARHEGAKQQLVTQMEDLTEQLTGAKSEGTCLLCA
jgi:molecular chaperone GrpE (heat shock protein)